MQSMASNMSIEVGVAEIVEAVDAREAVEAVETVEAVEEVEGVEGVETVDEVGGSNGRGAVGASISRECSITAPESSTFAQTNVLTRHGGGGSGGGGGVFCFFGDIVIKRLSVCHAVDHCQC